MLKYQYRMGGTTEYIYVGDSDGDGKLEFLIGRESFPTGVYSFEAVSDDAYTLQAVMGGVGGDCNLAGTYDLDGDGHPETVFTDHKYGAPGYPYAGVLSVYEGGSLVYRDQLAAMYSWSLGDTDGNGLGDIIGSVRKTKEIKILESTGSGNDFVTVLEGGSSNYYPIVIDVDSDGISELWGRIDTGSGRKDVFTLAHREGGTLIDFYNSGSLLQGYIGNITGVMAIGDTNGDGHLELAVTQGAQLHILEGPSSIIEVDIDIGLGSDSHPINLRSRGKVPVVVLSSDKCDATAMDLAAVTLADGSVARTPKGRFMASFEDVDGDGLVDAVLHFETEDLQLTADSTHAVLRGSTYDGEKFEGSAAVTIVPR